MNLAKNYFEDFIHLLFPHVCIGCNADIINTSDVLCAECLNNLPVTGFINTPANLVEKIFYGRLNVQQGGSAFYFTKDSVIQNIITQLKYKDNRSAGIFLGKLLGLQLAATNRFDSVDVIVPMPLNEKKEFQRGYNQTALIAEGITSVWNKAIITDAVERVVFTETQTHKTRVDRWQTMQDVFVATQPELIAGKHVLLIDDIVTTGATFEACGKEILNLPGCTLSLASVAYTI